VTSLFWIGAAALLGAVLMLLLRPLLRPPAAPDSAAELPGLQVLREQLAQLETERREGTLAPDSYERARAEIERRALEEAAMEAPAAGSGSGGGRAARSAAALVLGLPLGTIALYLALGNPQALQAQPAPDEDAATAHAVEDMVGQLAQRLQSDGGDLRGWTMLARSYTVLERYDDASRAYARARALAPEDAQLLADHADVLASLQQSRFDGEPARLVERALKLDPHNVKALALAGAAAAERGDVEAAQRHWTLARELAPPESDFAASLDRSLEQARAAQR
jgi:cytochrome c-type biogenesis protein CcmH